MASLMWRLGRKWSGGFEAFVDVSGLTADGFAVRIDFGPQFTEMELLATDGATQVSSPSEPSSVLLLAPNLAELSAMSSAAASAAAQGKAGGAGAGPPSKGKGTITLRVRGSSPGSPRVSCVNVLGIQTRELSWRPVQSPNLVKGQRVARARISC